MTSFALMTLIVECAYNGIEHDGTLAISRKGVVPGEIAWDECACGQLVIAEQRRYPAVNFPTEEIDHVAECGAPWLVTVYLLSLTRCVPTTSANGIPPSIDALGVAAEQLDNDMSAIRHAVECCLDEQYNSHAIGAYELGAQEIIGPQGGCLSTTLLITVGSPNGCGCG